ncbi:unnamed protein product [Penicillium nalgiovense]|nr:unnamed protein product [Penicillium nalgiovense]
MPSSLYIYIYNTSTGTTSIPPKNHPKPSFLQPILSSNKMTGRASDRCPFMARERLVDPEDDAALWVTIEFPRAMKFTHTDEQLIDWVVHQIVRDETSISACAQHYQRHLCLSLPIVGIPRGEGHYDTVRDQAKTLALWWHGEIMTGRVYLDRSVFFP